MIAILDYDAGNPAQRGKSVSGTGRAVYDHTALSELSQADRIVVPESALTVRRCSS